MARHFPEKMRSGSEDQFLLEQSKSDDDIPQFHKESKISYTRNFLLSLSELDTCKSLPSGLDQSILREIYDSRTGLLQPCQCSDSRRFHGLLGNGAFPRVSSISGASASLFHDNGFHLLNRSNAAYQPPHRCKEKVHFRTESEDCNKNKTFGSSEHLSRERVEEEGKRKDSCELMQEEKHKTFQEKQNKKCDEHKENLDPEIAEPLEASGNYKRLVNKYNDADECAVSLSPASDSAGLDVTTQSPAANLISPVPNSRFLKMDFGTMSLSHSLISEPCDVRRDHSEGFRFHSSDFSHQFLEESKPAGNISSNDMKGDFDLYTVWNKKVTQQGQHNSTNLTSRRNELVQKVMASTSTSATKVISEQFYNCHLPNVTKGVLTGEDFEISMLSELNDHYSNQHHSVKGWSPYDRKGRLPNSAPEHGASQHLLSFIENKLDQSDMETSSKLNMGSLDKFLVSENGDNGFAKDLQPTEFPVIQADSVGVVTRNDILKPHGLPFPASGNNDIIHPAFNESGPIEINCEGITTKSCGKQTAASKSVESLLISDDIQTKIGFNLGSKSESNLSPVSGFHESADSMDEICLPDEDSLITVEDFILPQDSTFSADDAAVKSDLFSINSHVDNADKLEAFNLSIADEISTQLSLDGPIFDSCDVVGLWTSYQSVNSQRSFSHFDQHQINPGREFFKSSDAQEVKMNYKMRSFDLKTYLYNPQPLHHFPTKVLSDHFQRPHADKRRFGHPINSPLLQQKPIPIKSSSSHQFHELPRGSPSHQLTNEMTCYTEELLHPTQNFPLYYGQQYYEGLEIPIADHIAGGTSDKAASNRLFEMEVRSRHIHPHAVAGRSSEILGKQVDMGFWYGK